MSERLQALLSNGSGDILGEKTETSLRTLVNLNGLDQTSANDINSSDPNGLSTRRLSVAAFTGGLWEFVTREGIESDTPTSPTELPPLPTLPPVGPARPRPRSCALSRSHSMGRPPPRLVRQNAASDMHVLPRSQSVADVFSAVVTMGLKTSGRRATPRFSRASGCEECGRRFSLICRRHHCRMCERSVCASCSAYQRVKSDIQEELDTENDRYADAGQDTENKAGSPKPSDNGSKKSYRRPHPQLRTVPKVCRQCALDTETRQSLHTRSWLDEFVNLRLFFKRERHLGEDLESYVQLPVRTPRHPAKCKTLAVTFAEDYRRSSQQKSRFLPSSSSFNSGLQYALKPPTQKMCGSCAKLLRFPTDRKTCALCHEIFCRNCSSHDLALSLSDNLDPGDISHEASQVEARVLTEEESEELDKSGSPNVWHANGALRQRLRVCGACLHAVKRDLSAMDFDDSLTRLQAELVDLQEQIAAVLDDGENTSPGGGLSRWPSVRSVHTYTSVEEEIAGEAVSFKVTQKLLERFLQAYLQLERLRPETPTQAVLFKHVKQAMTSFYMTRRSMAAKRFHRHESHVALPSPYFNL